jgi:hypothetical protein
MSAGKITKVFPKAAALVLQTAHLIKRHFREPRISESICALFSQHRTRIAQPGRFGSFAEAMHLPTSAEMAGPEKWKSYFCNALKRATTRRERI